MKESHPLELLGLALISKWLINWPTPDRMGKGEAMAEGIQRLDSIALRAAREIAASKTNSVNNLSLGSSSFGKITLGQGGDTVAPKSAVSNDES